MRRFLLRRFSLLLPGFFGITFAVFVLVRAAPGDPLASAGDEGVAAGSVTAAAIREYRAHAGLDDPVPTGYVRWLGGLVRGDLGRSFKDGQPVARKLADALPVTLLLSGLALLIVWAVAVPAGVLCALRPGSALDRATSTTFFALHSMPVPWLAMLLVATLGAPGLLPIQGLRTEGVDGIADRLAHLVLPLTCLAAGAFAFVSRYVRAGLLDVLRQDFVRAAQARGLPPHRVLWHAMRNVLPGLFVLLGLALPGLVGGAVIVERVFGLPGMGRLAFEAVLSRDLPVIMGNTALAGVMTMTGLLLADVAGAAADPRLRGSVP